MNTNGDLLPVVVTNNMAMLPGILVHFDIQGKMAVAAVRESLEKNIPIFVVAQRKNFIDKPELDDLYGVGTVSKIKQIIQLPGGMIRVLAAGEKRAMLLSMAETGDYMSCDVEYYNEEEEPDYVKEAAVRSIKDLLSIYQNLNTKITKEIYTELFKIDDADLLINKTATVLTLPVADRQRILEANSIYARCEIVTGFLAEEIQILKVKREIDNKVRLHVEKNQREFIMREEIKVLKKELGEDDQDSDANKYFEQLGKLNASEKVKGQIEKEIKRFQRQSGSPAESAVLRGYIEKVMALPWDNKTQDNNDVRHAEKVLDEDHYGLLEVKKRILEFLAVRALNADNKEKEDHATVLCLAGPPGTGKTSVAKSIARALNRKYIRVCLGGVRDEAEIRGHRRTYIGAMPGRIIDALVKAETSNPLILLDEIDKISTDRNGECSAALLEVLDPEQNKNFVDHYVEIPVDLSDVLFVCTANSLEGMDKPLLDRMEIIDISSYTAFEKFNIAKKYLVNKELKFNGNISPDKVKISDGAIKKIVSSYTREAGVRNLERSIGTICRKCAYKIMQGGEPDVIRVNEKNLKDYLGKEKYHVNKANAKSEIGIVRGLAWTSAGGDTLEIEVNVMPGSGKLSLTGKLGDVMKESAQTAISYVRACSGKTGVSEDFFEKNDIHIHVPEGAVPKDGPSAGITMATAVYSAVSGIPVREDVAMTGEISLRGRVLPIGGLKEKLIAAGAAGIKTVLVPKENESDIDEISKEVLEGLEIVFVSKMEEVLSKALER